MDLIYTNANGEDQGVLAAYSFDLSFGASENDFELTVSADAAPIDYGATVYIEGTEYGGTIDAMKASTRGETVTYKGRTWHGVLNSKVIQPDAGADYYTVSGDANSVLAALVARLGLSAFFTAADSAAGINIQGYQFARYCKGYDGLRAMLAANGAVLLIEWRGRAAVLSAAPVVDYTQAPFDGDMATLTVEQTQQKVNHLICLGKGDLAAREVIHLYVDQYGQIGNTQHYTGADEIADVYENANSEDLRKDGMARLAELQNSDKAEIVLSEADDPDIDIGDIVGAHEIRSGVRVSAAVSQKIVKIQNGTVKVEYKLGE